jgi:arginase
VEETVRDGRTPVVLGGDCSVLLGSLLGLKRIGRFGLAYIDGHSDFYTPATSSTGGVAGMDLAIACGRAVKRLATLAAPEALVLPEDVVLLGRRDLEQARTLGGEPDGAVQDWPLRRIRDAGLRNAAKRAVEHFRSRAVDGVWVHIDADVLHDDLMPAVDSRQADGMTYGELSGILAALMKSCRVAGVEVTIFDPDKDPTGQIASGLATALARGLNAAVPARERRT